MREASTFYINTNASTTCAWCSHRKRISLPSAAIPDNFQFPRWSLDFSILRAYEHGRPAKTLNYLKINFAGPRADELVFVAGHPGTTQRLETARSWSSSAT